MTDREKLIELLDDVTHVYHFDAWENTDKIADHLLTNGVTFAKDTNVPSKWISVENDTPKNRRDVLVWAFWHETWQPLPGWYAPSSKIWHVFTAAGDKTDLIVSHWQEMPEPPREEL